MTDLEPAADGYPARVVEQWSHEKLYYVERYVDIFCMAMKDKWTLVYGDFLAGPGLCIDQETHEQSLGSPLRALRRTEFQRLFLNDANPQVAAALRARTANEPPGRVCVASLDCNQAVEPARVSLFPPSGSNGTLGLAVIDPTAFQMSFDAVARLTYGVKLDLLIIFMSGYIRRFISTPEFARVLDAFFGTTAWRDLVGRKHAGERLTYRHLLDLYEEQLRGIGYVHVDDSQRMTNLQGATIYHIIFASKHPRGAEFFKKISQQKYNGQRRLFP
jgi:three-Cys-motif partner protein